MKKLVAENLNEYLAPEVENENINEALTVRGAVENALKNPNKEDLVNSAIKASFAATEQMKAWLLKQPLEKKVGFLKAGAEKLKDPKMSYLKYVKGTDGQWVVGAVPAQGVKPGKE